MGIPISIWVYVLSRILLVSNSMFTRDKSMHAPGHSQSKGKIESVAVQQLPRLGDGDGDDPRTASVDVR